MKENTAQSKIIYCESKPIRIAGTDWLYEHIGRISVGRKIASNLFDIIAYSDDRSDSKVLRGYARKQGAFYIRSVDNRGVTSID